MKRSHIIALSGISCALALICVVGSIYVEFMTLSLAVLSAICIQMPLTQKYLLGGILSYVSTSIFAFLIGNINALPFILFFGAYVLVQWLIEEKLSPLIKNKILKYSVAYVIKIGYFEAVIAIFWFLFNKLIPAFIIFGNTIEMTYLIVSLAGIPLFLLYDLMMHLVFKNFTIVINKIIKKTTKTTTPDDIMYNGEENPKEDVFSDFDITDCEDTKLDNEQESNGKPKDSNIDNA